MKGLVNINQKKSNHISIPFISKPFIFELIVFLFLIKKNANKIKLMA